MRTENFQCYNLIMKYLVALAFLINLASWGMIFYFVPETNFPFIVRYNVFAGQDFFGTKISLFSLSALGLLILMINVILALLLIKFKARDLAMIILGMTCFFQSLIVIYSWIIVFINNY